MTTDPWNDDLLDRENDAEFIYRLTVGRNVENVRLNKGSFVLNIDAPWGQGKSFFLRGLYQTVLQREHPAIFINAWQFDFVDDPFAICVAALDEYFKSIEDKEEITNTQKFQEGLRVVRSQFLNITWTLGKAVLKKAINKVAENGVDEVASLFTEGQEKQQEKKGLADELAETVSDQIDLFTDAAIDKFAQKQIDSINETKRSLGLFQGGLTAILDAMGEAATHKLPMYIFVDELDRCRPTYAISMLERIKHIFDIPNVVFIIATDTVSLSHSVKAVYGTEFRSKEYLGRFFHRTYKLPAASNENIIYALLQDRGPDISKWSLPTDTMDIQSVAVFLDKTSQAFDLNIRPTKQAVEILLDITSAWDQDIKIELSYMFTLTCQFVKTGDLVPTEFSAVVRDSSTWRDVCRNEHFSYRELTYRIRNLATKDVAEALKIAQEARSENPDVVTHYIHGILRTEFGHHQRTGRDKPLVSFASYDQMILYARNLQ
ncbi:KAP family P-loop NTPase fold protein [Agrobacterium cavarae]|uniref:KAP family P-loop NTPase fold protein n=1 Tax=Agrobacterium cavarae TaxID=2528239 RepID=UPI003CFEFEF0